MPAVDNPNFLFSERFQFRKATFLKIIRHQYRQIEYFPRLLAAMRKG